MLIGYVSDERYVALADVLIEFEREGRRVNTRSTASGAVEADLVAGTYSVTLSTTGFGAKRVELNVPPAAPHQFRLLSDELLGYAWPKWVKSGEKSEFRVHSPEAYKLSLWRYGWKKERVRKIGWFDEHGPDATRQITPDGDYTQTGVQWNKFGYASPHHKQFVEAPDRSGLYFFHAKTESGRFFSFPWIVAPRTPRATIAVLASNITWNAYNNFGGRSNYIHPDRFPPTPTVNARLELKRYTDPRHLNYDTVDYDPLSFDRPEPINHVPENVEVTDPDRRAGRLPRRPGRMEAAGMAGARRIRVRLLRRDAIPFRPARPRSIQGADPEHAPRVLVADDVRPFEVVGLRARRSLDVPGRKRAQLRCRIPGRVDVHLSQRRRSPAHRTGFAIREPLSPPPRVRGQPARRRLFGNGHHDGRTVPGRRRRSLDLSRERD